MSINNCKDSFAQLCEQLDDLVLIQPSKKLHFLLHKCVWASSSELYDELGREMRSIKASHWDTLPFEVKRAFELAAQSVRTVYPEFEI